MSDIRPSSCSVISCRLTTDRVKSPPLGPLYIATAAQSAGYTIELIDFQTHSEAHVFDVSGLVEAILRAKYSIIAISLFGDALPLVVAAISVYDQSYGGKNFILGGPGVNENELAILTQFPAVSAIVRGEGEMAFPLVLDALCGGITIDRPGVYMRTAAVSSSDTPTRLRDIDTLAHPDLKLIELKKYGRLDVVSSRGCPFDCSFCEIITMWGRRVTYRSVSDFTRELKELVAATGIRDFSFIDDTFTINRRRVQEICSAIIADSINISWGCFSRVDTIDESLAAEMAAAGCRRIFFGVDTGSELLWRNINKNFSRRQVIEVLGGCVKHVDLIASYIWGYPEETYADFTETIDLAYTVSRLPKNGSYSHRVTTQLHFLSPTRATPIFATHSDKLKFSENVPLEITGGRPLSLLKDEDGGYEMCLSLIKSDPAMFASYYYYDSPDLEQKFASFKEALKICERALGSIALAKDRQSQLLRVQFELVTDIEREPTPDKKIAYLRLVEILASQEDQISSLPNLRLEDVSNESPLVYG